MSEVDISIVIPAYNERERIEENLMHIYEHMQSLSRSYEVIIVIDGSKDETAVLARTFADRIENLRIIENEINRGKGAVVRQGLLNAKGQIQCFLDADGSTSITHIDQALTLIGGGADFVVGSRDIPGAEIAVSQPFLRELMGTMGNWMIRCVLGLWRFPDTQCGFKVMTREVSKKVVPLMVVDRFGYDFEMIVLAKKCGFQIEQMPVRWLNEEGSKVGGLFGPNGFVQVLIDLYKTRWRLWTNAYGLRK